MSVVILGAGVTGLAAGMASGAPVFEAAATPGGICSSYYVRPGAHERLPERPRDGEAYRFEIGGGHWIFGGDPLVLAFIARLTPVRSYARRSSVHFPEEGLAVPYPLQNHLHALGKDLVARALAEMARPYRGGRTMREWLEESFGPTLCARFFYPFHALYTAGLYERIAPQDAYKSPVNLQLAIRGAVAETPPAVGYNVEFVYPEQGLDTLARRLAADARVSYGKRAVRIDLHGRAVHFEDGTSVGYETLLSTLPLNRTLEIAGLRVEPEPDPFTSVLVLNVGGRRGPRCPDDHWIYVPTSRAGFHRVGFYDAVDSHFLPASNRRTRDRVSMYVERAYLGGQRPSAAETQRYVDDAVRELQDWGFLDAVEVADPTWIDVAYTWSWPGSAWVRLGMRALEQHRIFSAGRYGRWTFQGIAESLREGFAAGATLRAG
jgi:protoporphyrinogen oxidase